MREPQPEPGELARNEDAWSRAWGAPALRDLGRYLVANGMAAGYARARFNPGNTRTPGFELLYLVLDQNTALLEKQAQCGSPYAQPVTYYSCSQDEVVVHLQNVIDLADINAHAALATTAQELTGDWMGHEVRGMATRKPVLTAPAGEAPTQILGWETFQEPGVEGVRVISARDASTCCLVVFTHKLQRPARLAWNDPNTNRRESYP